MTESEFARSRETITADEVYCRDFHDIEDILPEQDNAFLCGCHT